MSLLNKVFTHFQSCCKYETVHHVVHHIVHHIRRCLSCDHNLMSETTQMMIIFKRGIIKIIVHTE